MPKYRVRRTANKNYQIANKIKQLYFPTIPWASLSNEFEFRYYQEHFPEIVEEDREEEGQNASC
jgi:hypothetical protein